MKKIFSLILSVVIFLGLFSGNVFALESGPCVETVVTDISPTSINIGEEFTVGILIDNCGDEIPEEIVFELTNISPYVEIKEPLIKQIGKMGYANSERFIIYNMKVSDDAVPGEYVFDFKTTFKGSSFSYQNEGDFSIKVIGDEAKIDIASVKVNPVFPKANEEFTLTIRLENFGDGDANSLKSKIDLPFDGNKQSFVGTLDSGDDGIIVFNLIAKDSGNFDYNLDIDYSDDFGEKSLTENLEITIIENSKPIFPIVILVVIILFVILFFLRRKSRNKRDR